MTKEAASYIGKGFNSATGEVLASTALKPSKITEGDLSNTHYHSAFTQHLEQSAREDIASAAVQGKATVVNLEGRFKVETAESREKNELTYVMRYYKADRHVEFKDDVSFKSADQTMLAEDVDEFYTTNGDSYISKVVYGKELTVIVKFKLDEQTDKRKYMSELGLAEGTGIVNVSALYSQSRHSAKKDIQCEIELHESGGNITHPKKITDLKELLKWIDDIGNQFHEGKFAEAKSVPLFLERTPYARVKCLKGKSDNNSEPVMVDATKAGAPAQTAPVKDAINQKSNLSAIAQYTTEYIKIIAIAKERAAYFIKILPQQTPEEIKKVTEIQSTLTRLMVIENSIKKAKLSERIKVIRDHKPELIAIRTELDKIRSSFTLKTYEIEPLVPRKSDDKVFKHKVVPKFRKDFKKNAISIILPKPFTFAYKNMGIFSSGKLKPFDASKMKIKGAPGPNTTVFGNQLKGRKLYITTTNQAAAEKGTEFLALFRSQTKGLESTTAIPTTPKSTLIAKPV